MNLILAQCLESAFKKSLEAQLSASSEEATSMLKSRKFDLIICEYRTHRMRGLDLVKEIRAEHSNVLAIILVHPGYQLNEAQSNKEIDGYLCRPFKLARLFDMIEDLLGIESVEAVINKQFFIF